MLKNKKGITLIALVVTIVILLILAGVSISLILDNNGIIEKSKDAKREYGKARENEQADLNNASNWIDEITNAPEIVEPENIDDWEYKEEDGNITLNGYKGNDTTVIIPNHINGKPVKKIGYLHHGTIGSVGTFDVGTFWDTKICSSERKAYFYVQDTITRVVVTEGIEEIHDNSFQYMSNIEEIEFPKSVKSINISYMFLSEYNFSHNKIVRIKIPFSKNDVPDTWELPSDEECDGRNIEIVYKE